MVAVAGNGGFNTYYYRDIYGRLTNVVSTAGLNLKYGYNMQGMVIGVTNLAGTLYSAAYDANDLPDHVVDSRGAMTTTTFDALGRLLTSKNGLDHTETFTYGPKGLMEATDPMYHVTQYGYDAAGRLAAITNANLEVTQFGYNPAGELASLTDGRNNTKRWAYDIYGRQIAETNAAGILVRTNGYNANGWLTAQWTAAKGKTTFTYDNNGNVLTVAHPASSGNVVAKYLYDPFGNLLAKSGAMADVNRYRFSSKEVHLNSGSYYYGFRFYEPNFQRWLNEDPIRERGGMNLFRAFANSPLNTIDPDGRDNMYNPRAGQNAPVNFCFSMPVGGGPVDSEALGTDPLAVGATAGVASAAYTAGQMALGYAESMIPLKGEYDDMSVINDPSSTEFEKKMSRASLEINVASGGILPNAGTFIKKFKNLKPCPPKLRSRLGDPPSGMVKPQAHHDLPQADRFQKYWEREGLDINDPAHGRWVEGGPGGSHQKWSKEFNNEWDNFFGQNPNASKEQILEKMNQLRNDSRFQ